MEARQTARGVVTVLGDGEGAKKNKCRGRQTKRNDSRRKLTITLPWKGRKSSEISKKRKQ